MRKQLLAPDENHHKVRIEDDALIAAVNLSHLAICGVDIDLSWLGDSLNARHHYPSSFGMLLTQGGDYVAGCQEVRPRAGTLAVAQSPPDDEDKIGDNDDVGYTNSGQLHVVRIFLNTKVL